MIKPFLCLQKMYALSDKDINFLKKKFIENKIFKNELFIGQFFNEIPTMLIGAPCIRKDIEGISLNTFYQIFMPLRVASTLQLSCKILLGIREEILLQPKRFQEYEDLKRKIMRGTNRIAQELNTKVEIIDTSFLIHDRAINECINKLHIELSVKESTNLFNLSIEKEKKTLHSDLRTYVDERVIASNALHFLNGLFSTNKFLIIEDIEQYKCILYAKKFSKGKRLNFLALLPLPSISGTSCMARAEKQDRIILNQKKNYGIILKQSPSWVLEIYNELFSLVTSKTGKQNFTLVIQKIASFFD